MLIACVLLYLALVSALIFVAYHKRYFQYYALVKTAASCCFLAMACAAFFTHGQQNAPFFFMLMVCLLFCFAGDVLLGLANTHGKLFSRYFLCGMCSFMAAHVGFVALFTLFSPGARAFHWTETLVPAALLCVTSFCARHKAFRLRRMAVPALLYSVLVGFMCVKGISFAAACAFSTRGLLIAAGGILFLISDGVILFLYFYLKPRRALRAVNLITYYAGLLCIALAA